MSRQDIAAYALESMTKAGADLAACSVVNSRKDEFNIEAGKFTLMRSLFNDSLNLKAICGGKKGVTVVNKIDRESVDNAVADCIALAQLATPDDAEDIAEKIENKSFDLTIGGSDMDKLFTETKSFLDQMSSEYPKIVLEGVVSEFNSSKVTYVNSKGVEFNSNKECYDFSAMFTAKDGEKMSSFNGFGGTLAALDIPFIDLGMGRTLFEESVKSLDTRLIEEKFVGKVIVTPHCEDIIWGTILDCFLTDRPLIEGTSRWKDALYSSVADKKLTMRLAPHHPSAVCGERYTSDGYESKDVDLIKNGILESFALSLYGARKTGNKRALNTAFSNIEVIAGDTPLSDMIKSVDRGILLNRFSGASPGASGDVSGVAKNSFLIENGKVTDALSETMVSFNIVDVIKDIVAISAERITNGVSILPWCCFDGITISGK